MLHLLAYMVILPPATAISETPKRINLENEHECYIKYSKIYAECEIPPLALIIYRAGVKNLIEII